MKRLSLLLVSILAFICGWAQEPSVMNPEAGKDYFIYHNSGALMTWTGKAQIYNAGEKDNQRWQFELVDGTTDTYYIKSVSMGQYLGSDNSYTAKMSADNSTDFYKIKIEAGHEEGTVRLYNVGRGRYYGTDSNSNGSGFYTDKSGTDGKHLWRINLAVDGFITTALEGAIANATTYAASATSEAVKTYIAKVTADAQAVLDAPQSQGAVNAAAETLNTLVNDVKVVENSLKSLAGKEEGTEVGQYLPEVRQAFAELIASTEAALTGTPEEVAAALATLTEGKATFEMAYNNIVPDASKLYYILQTTTGNIWNKVSGKNYIQLTSPDGSETQRWHFVPVEGKPNLYNIVASDGSYAGWKSGWDTYFDSADNDNTRFYIELCSAADQTIYLNRSNLNGRMGNDSGDPNIYSNKWNNTTIMKLIEYVEGSVLTFALDKAIAEAKETADNAKVGEGTWMYSEEAVAALRAAIATAEEAIKTVTEQAGVEPIRTELLAAVATFKAAQQLPAFTPAADAKYRFATSKYSDKYMTAGETSIGTAVYTAGDTNQHWNFVQGENGYKIVNGDRALAVDFTLVPVAEAPEYQFVYTNQGGNYWNQFALVQAADPTKVLAFGSGTTPNWQNLDKGNNAHQGRFTLVDMPNDPDMTELLKAIYLGEEWLRYVTFEGKRGNEIGMWNDNKCNTLQAAIDAAKARKGLTAEEVNLAKNELNNAIENFRLNPNKVEKGNLDEMIAGIKAAADSAVVGTAVGEFYLSKVEEIMAAYEAFAARAAKASEQADVDSLTQEVYEYYNAIAGNTTEQAIADVYADAVAVVKAFLATITEANIGIDKGQYTQAAYDKFAAAVTAAETAEATAENLAAVIAARAEFKGAVNTVDRSALRKAIEAAQAEDLQNLVAGEFNGNYSADAIAAKDAALTAATEGLNNLALTQEDVTALATALNKAVSELRKSKVVINFKALDSAISTAEPLAASVTVIGEGEGECPTAVVDAYKAAIATAKNADRAAVTQADVDALAANLNQATADFRTALVASTGLSTLVATAEGILADAEEGMKPGNYPANAIAGLTNAIATAKGVATNVTATQSELLAAKADLQTAITKFQASAVPAHNTEALAALVAEVEAFIANNNIDNKTLNRYVKDAKAALSAPNDYTTEEFQEVYDNLNTAYQNVLASGVEGVDAENFAIVVRNGKVAVNGIATPTSVAVYSINGALVVAENAVEGNWNVELTPGAYVIALGNGVIKSVIVR